MRSWLFPARQTEATPTTLVATGAAGGAGFDPIDNDYGWQPLGATGREQPWWTTERARAYSVAAYRSNPMARAIIDTYDSFAVGDSGVSLQCDDPQVRAVIDTWWTDPRNSLGELQSLLCRDWLLMGEQIWEYMVGEMTGVVRFSPIDPSRVTAVNLDRGNPLWHKSLSIRGRDEPLEIAQLDDMTGLRAGKVSFSPSWRATLLDRRGVPFLSPVLDDLDAYSQVLSNLVDRTALARYLVWDVTLKGEQNDVDEFIAKRGGQHVPRSGTVEVHNESVEWKPQQVTSGSFEDTNTAGSVLTNVAAGAGLAKTWISEPDGANRATSLSMAEPVRRRVGGVQQEWLEIITKHARFVVDQAVAVGRLPRLVPTTDIAGDPIVVPPAQLVRATGPEIAAADAQVMAGVFVKLSEGLAGMVTAGIMSKPAAEMAARKAWEQFMGQPWRSDLSINAAGDDDLADEADKTSTV